MGVGGHNMRAKTSTVPAVGTCEFRPRLLTREHVFKEVLGQFTTLRQI